MNFQKFVFVFFPVLSLVKSNLLYNSPWHGDSGWRVGAISTRRISNRNLNLQPVKTIYNPANVSVCEEECTKTTGCISFNTVEEISSAEITECRLLNKDHFSYPFDLIIANGNYHVVYSQCLEPSPCPTADYDCIPHYNNGSYACRCKIGHHGLDCFQKGFSSTSMDFVLGKVKYFPEWSIHLYITFTFGSTFSDNIHALAFKPRLQYSSFQPEIFINSEMMAIRYQNKQVPSMKEIFTDTYTPDQRYEYEIYSTCINDDDCEITVKKNGITHTSPIEGSVAHQEMLIECASSSGISVEWLSYRSEPKMWRVKKGLLAEIVDILPKTWRMELKIQVNEYPLLSKSIISMKKKTAIDPFFEVLATSSGKLTFKSYGASTLSSANDWTVATDVNVAISNVGSGYEFSWEIAGQSGSVEVSSLEYEQVYIYRGSEGINDVADALLKYELFL